MWVHFPRASFRGSPASPGAGPPAAAPEVDANEDDDDSDVEGDDDGEVDDGLGGLLAEGGQPARVPPVDGRHRGGRAGLRQQPGEALTGFIID